VIEAGYIDNIAIFGLPVCAYIIGSVPWGLVLTGIYRREDIRRRGSGNIGATNVARIAGPTLGLLTLAGDISKGAVPVYLAISLLDSNSLLNEAFLSLVALATFFGHLYPLFLKFQGGGKGVATAAGAYAVLSPLACSIALAAFITSVLLSHRVSVGSLAAAAVLPVAVWFTTRSIVMTIGAVIACLFVFIRHMENIKRLLYRKEPMLFS
jgi:glycerol-3-phosphate acyltransferase PlsY